jgi:pimeloyl-ACP methyl ester carboxylesterase
VSYAEVLAAGIPDSDLLVIPGAGHLTPSEAPSAFNRAVREFLGPRSISGTGSTRPAPSR